MSEFAASAGTAYKDLQSMCPLKTGELITDPPRQHSDVVLFGGEKDIDDFASNTYFSVSTPFSAVLDAAAYCRCHLR